jgi:hypothetical protein
VDPARFSIAPVEQLPLFLKWWHYLAHNVVHDSVWLDRKEMLLWDHWGVQDGSWGLLDHVSAVTGN